MNNEMNPEQSVLLSNRSRMELSGISEVESFTDENILALSSLGDISIDGTELKIESFSAESGKLVVNGKFDGFCYFGREGKGRRRLFSRS